MRKDILLNGEWDFMPIYETGVLSLPKNIIYDREKLSVPSSWRNGTSSMGIAKYGFDPFNTFNYPNEWDKAGSGVIARTISVSEQMKENRLILKFDAIMKRSCIYLNGEKIAQSNEHYLPIYADITDAARVGENLLQVVCTESEAHKIPAGDIRTNELVGSWLRNTYLGIWQDAHLLILPQAHIADAEIVTSVRNQKIDVYVKTENCADGAAVSADIYDGDKVVKSLSAKCEKGQAVLSDKWENPILWDIENPHLYIMKLKLSSGDEMSIRFGFREFYADGEKFILNGTRVNLRGDSWHFQGAGQMTEEYVRNWCRLLKERGVNSIRYHAEPHPEFYLDVADEEGLLIVDETAIYGSGKSMDAGNPEYIENCRNHIKRFVNRDKNHASVVIWSLENEMRWVDGRDEFKKFIPEFMEIFHNADRSGRLISLDGDNRLIDKEITEVASLHYNIDGTIDQWNRQVPLTIGEHGGLWYVCPQNSSMYIGLSAYDNHERCAEGISVKEQLFMEYARRKDVSGISSFNFAHYFAESMPNEDVILEPRTSEGISKPQIRQIKKYSLTINNGLLKDYPAYIPNVTCKYAEAGMKPVTVIARDYNSSFYDDAPFERIFDVYNDTMHDQNVTLEITAEQNGEAVYSDKAEFVQTAGLRKEHIINISPKKVTAVEKMRLTIKQYHSRELKNVTEREYNIYPHTIKTEIVSDKRAAYFGGDADFEVIKKLLPKCERISDINDLTNDAQLLIVGSNIENTEQELQPRIHSFVAEGGNVLITEQFGFSLGTMVINKKKFLRAHASDYSHSVFDGLCNDDFVYWKCGAEEDGPDSFINSAFEKPVDGNWKMLLECSFGDFNDGGDLWSPMLEYSANGTVIASQVEIMDNFADVPEACVLLRNMIGYLAQKKNRYAKTGVLAGNETKVFLDRLGLKYDDTENIGSYELIIADAECLRGRESELKAFDGRLFIMPSENEDALSEIFGKTVKIEARPTYHLSADYSFAETKNVSAVDLFGYDKVGMSPREVKNRYLAYNTAECADAKTVLKSVEGTTWEDLFIDNRTAEYCKRALVSYNRELAEKPRSYAIKLGNKVFSQFIKDPNDEKSIRVYTAMLSNSGAEFEIDALSHIKGDAEYSIESVMALPYKSYQNYDRAYEYYTDPEFSLNNLGEGLYGWMKKFERHSDGYLSLTDSHNNTMFITCFVHALRTEDKEYILELDATDKFELYINGELTKPGIVTLKSGINRFFMLAEVGDEDFKFRPIFKNCDGSFATNLQYRLTVDEIDPK